MKFLHQYTDYLLQGPLNLCLQAKVQIHTCINSKRGGFIHMRHDNVRLSHRAALDNTIIDVQKEPPLQPIQKDSGEQDKTRSLTLDFRVMNLLAATAYKFH